MDALKREKIEVIYEYPVKHKRLVKRMHVRYEFGAEAKAEAGHSLETQSGL